ncbi:MAG TPA: methyltransferase domain-containing protein [Bacteroidales bacterium]|nr:methyltransferase domain-containing protein [Bacteroidales bacterium]
MAQRTWTDRDVEAHWDRVAAIYVEENNRVKNAHDQRFRETVRHLDLKDGMKVLNITSRDGEADDYVKAGAGQVNVINAEISSKLMEVAKYLRPAIHQVKISTYSNLPFDDESFDRIISLETLEHAAEPQVFLRELNRVAKDGARMVLSCPPATSELPYQVFTFLFGGHGEGPHRFPPSRKVKKWLKENGWKLLLHKGTVLIPVGPPWLQDLGEKILEKTQRTWISELGIRQFYVCEKA